MVVSCQIRQEMIYQTTNQNTDPIAFLNGMALPNFAYTLCMCDFDIFPCRMKRNEIDSKSITLTAARAHKYL